MPKMLIVDDDNEVAERIASVLREQGWSVEIAGTGADALQLMTRFQFDFVLLDWGLPQMSGVEVCQKYRESGGEAPIIFVTGRNSIDDKEVGFDAGGDDYITKPFHVRELLARVRALRRRPRKRVDNVLSAQGVILNPDLRTISRGSETVQLSALESAILEFLLRNKDRFFSAADLFEAVWDADTESTEETVRVRMRIIRQKLAKVGAESLIETVRGNGYVIRDKNE